MKPNSSDFALAKKILSDKSNEDIDCAGYKLDIPEKLDNVIGLIKDTHSRMDSMDDEISYIRNDIKEIKKRIRDLKEGSATTLAALETIFTELKELGKKVSKDDS